MDIILLISFCFGAIVGSFLNVVILRLPEEGRSIVLPASHCPQCKNLLHWYDNIPILSYLFLLGRCRTCKKKISIQYPLVELSMGLLSLGLMSRFGLGMDFAAYFLFCAALLVIIWIDFYHQIIPDSISLPGIITGFLFALVSPTIAWQDSLIGLLVGGGLLYLIAWGYFLLRRQEGMGGGDIKLLAMLGAFLGWQALPFIVLASSLSGSIVGLTAMLIGGSNMQTRIPFGPFLALAAMGYLFFSDQIQYVFYLYLSGALF